MTATTEALQRARATIGIDPGLNGHRPAGPNADLPEEFWSARDVLAHIRVAAHARQRSAPAVLHVVLARVAASLPHFIELPAIVGAPAALSYFAVALAPPGVGKSSANEIGAELVSVGPDVADQLPLGSGEGLVEVLFDLVDEANEDGKKVKVKRQTKFGAFVFVDEGQALDALGRRNGATLLPTLRTIWSGGTIGNTNASQERRRIVPAGMYTFGVVLALQDAKAGTLLDDADAGTPQRFAWCRATDPEIPDIPAAWPGPLDWTPPSPSAVLELPERHDRGYLRRQLPVDAAIVHELRSADLDRARGHGGHDVYDAHGGLLQLKIAALLAILDQRLEVTPDDWHLAQLVKASSDNVRHTVIDLAAQTAERDEQHTRNRLAGRAVATDEAVERRRIVDTARKIAEKVHAGQVDTIATLRRTLSAAQRDVLNAALEHATAEQWIVEQDEPSHTGDEKRRLIAGQRGPS